MKFGFAGWLLRWQSGIQSPGKQGERDRIRIQTVTEFGGVIMNSPLFENKPAREGDEERSDHHCDYDSDERRD